MIVSVHRSAWFRAELEPGTRLARVARTDEPFDDPATAEQAQERISTLVWPRPKNTLRLLFDLRSAPPRNDPEFERIAQRHAAAMFLGWEKAAILVTSQVGKLQLDRLSRERGGPGTPVFHDESAAIAYLLA